MKSSFHRLYLPIHPGHFILFYSNSFDQTHSGRKGASLPFSQNLFLQSPKSNLSRLPIRNVGTATNTDLPTVSRRIRSPKQQSPDLHPTLAGRPGQAKRGGSRPARPQQANSRPGILPLHRPQTLWPRLE